MSYLQNNGVASTCITLYCIDYHSKQYLWMLSSAAMSVLLGSTTSLLTLTVNKFTLTTFSLSYHFFFNKKLYNLTYLTAYICI